MNFDGVKDLRLMSSKDVQNTYYHCYVWDINSASFVLDEVLSLSLIHIFLLRLQDHRMQ